MQTNISIVIPTYNRSALLGPTLESVKGLTVPAGVSIEVLVIDNNCTDDTPGVVERAGIDAPFSIRRILETRQGLCYGRNRGIAEARGEHLVYLDDDIEASSDWLHSYFEALHEYGADCVVGPVFPKFTQDIPDYCTPRIIQSIDSYYSRKGDEILILPPEVAHQVPGCNFGVRKVVAEEIGGFNPKLDRVGKGLLAGGDTEFGKRLVAAARRVVYHPKCSIHHVLTPEKLSKAYLRKRWTGMGTTQRALRNGSDDVPLPRKLRSLLGIGRLAAASVYQRLRGHPSLAFQRELEARQSWAFICHHRTDRRGTIDACLHHCSISSGTTIPTMTSAKRPMERCSTRSDTLVRDFVELIERLDIGLFAAIPSETTDGDKRSLLAVQRAVARRHPGYAYLEIGSHLGGSLQTHFIDHRCRAVYSIDPRPAEQPDERVSGLVVHYGNNSTARMLSLLEGLASGDLCKVRCFDLDASDVDAKDIEHPPKIAFIDGEHTCEAVMSDFRFCRKVLSNDGVVVFHDWAIVMRALERICRSLKRERVPHLAFKLDGNLFAIFFDPELVYEDPYLSYLWMKNGPRPWRLFRKERLKRLLPEPILQAVRAARGAFKRT